jgi:hypothetical protein
MKTDGRANLNSAMYTREIGGTIAFLLPIYLCVVSAPLALARFGPDDATELDQENRLNSESYNDAKSYEFPFSWQRDWRQSRLGYRVSAGSLNVSKFLYREDFKLIEVVPDVGMMSLVQGRYEDFLQQSRRGELRLAGYVGHNCYLGPVAEGGYFKKWGDLGGVVGVGSPAGAFLEAEYYLVDLYYNEKEDSNDTYSRQPWAFTLAGRSDLRTRWFWEFHYEYESPVRWERLSENYIYTNYRQALSLHGTLPWSETLMFLSNLDLERKTEGKDWLAFPQTASFERNVGTEDLSFVYTPKDSTLEYNGGASIIYRRALYHYSNPNLQAQPAVVDSEILPDSQRREFMSYLLVSKPLNNAQTQALRGGPIWSYSLISENSADMYANEVKLQMAYEFKIGKNVSTLLNTNWDLDNLWVDAPYHQKPFSPWDGGNIQIQALF